MSGNEGRLPYYTPASLVEIRRGLAKVKPDYVRLLIEFNELKLSNDNAKEYALHGFGRRLSMLHQCIQNTFSICPPETQALSDYERRNLTINIQCFIFNLYGCLDNLAWVWVHEKQIKDKKGNALSKRLVGLTSRYEIVRSSFSQDFQDYLASRDSWLEQHLVDLRDSLAHRIPMYIPPSVVNKTVHDDLESRKAEALKNHDIEEYERLDLEQKSSAQFRPWITHSFSEHSKPRIIHPQVLNDWVTLVEFSEKFLDEIGHVQKLKKIAC